MTGHLGFSIAKLVAESKDATTQNTIPSKWVNYEFVKMPTTAAANGSIVATPDPEFDIANLVDNGDGTYQYTFDCDLGKVKGIAATLGASLSKPFDVADLGDLTFDTTATHRVIMMLGGAAGGTPVAKSVTVTYDFVPSGAAVTATRELVEIAACNSCHQHLALHGSFFPPVTDTKACVVCHTDQMKYGSTESYPLLVDSNNTGTTLVPGPNPEFAAFDSGNTTRIDGRAVPAFPNFIHKIHMGENLGMTGTDFLGTPFDTRFPQDVKNCTKCHIATGAQKDNWNMVPNALACGACHDTISFTSSSGVNHPGLQQLNDAKCATCHTSDLIVAAHLPITPPDLTNGGLPASSGGVAGNTHTNASFIASTSDRLPATAMAITWVLNTASVDANGHPTWNFTPYLNGSTTPATIQTYAASTTNELFANMVGTPSLYMAFSIPQDGIANPADFNSSVSVSMKAAWRGTTAWAWNTASAPNVWSGNKDLRAGGTTWTANPDGSYTAHYAAATIPASATHITAGIGFNYGVVSYAAVSNATATQLNSGSLTDALPLTQTNLPSPYAYSAATFQGGLSAPAPVVRLAVNSSDVRREVVDNTRCQACHLKLGLFTNPAVAATFHSGQRNDGAACVFCHNVNGFDATSFWSYNTKEIVHAIHSADMRTQDFTWEPQDSMWNIGYPGVLNDCQQCHLAGTYDFTATDSAAALPNLLWTTVGAGTTPASATAATAANGGSPISEYVNWAWSTNYGTGFYGNTSLAAASKTWPSNGTGTPITGNVAVGSTLEADPTTLVSSPISSACFACHDSAATRAHITTNGGSLFVARSTVETVSASLSGTTLSTTVTSPITTKVEQCLLCHGAGAVADIDVVHGTF